VCDSKHVVVPLPVALGKEISAIDAFFPLRGSPSLPIPPAAFSASSSESSFYKVIEELSPSLLASRVFSFFSGPVRDPPVFSFPLLRGALHRVFLIEQPRRFESLLGQPRSSSSLSRGVLFAIAPV